MDEGNFIDGGDYVPNDATPATDVPIARRGGLDIAALLQQANTGSQGRPVPSYATEAANVGSRVAKILERNLAEMESDNGWDRIGAGLAADISSGGKLPYAVARQQFEGREVGRAVNIANAMAGLQKFGQNDIRQLGNLLQRRTEAEARQGNMKAQRINEMVRSAASGFDDSSMAAAHMYGFMARKQKENPNLDANELPGLMAEAIMDARRSGLTRKVAGRGGRGSGSGGGGRVEMPPMAADGSGPDYEKPFAKPKTAFERMWNMSDAETRKNLFKAQQDKLLGKKGEDGGVTITQNADGTTTVYLGAGGAKSKNQDDLVKAELSATSVVRTMDKIRDDLDKYGGNIVGWLGSAGGLISDVSAQVQTLLKGLPEGRQSDRVRSLFGDVGYWDSVMPAFVKTGPDAQVNKARFITLAYAVASAREPGGRLTEQDVARAMHTLGATGGNPKAIAKILDDVEAELVAGINDRRRRTPGVKGDFDPREGRRRAAPQDLSKMSTEDLIKELD